MPAHQKIQLLDWLIHEFHIQSGVSGRLVAMNTIQGSRDQLVELLFRRVYTSHAQVLGVAAQLGIPGRNKMAENVLISEILRLAPELAVAPLKKQDIEPVLGILFTTATLIASSVRIRE
jgi:hypothetical protein